MNEIILRAGFRALLVAPLLRGKDVVGMLVIRRRTPGAFLPNTVDLIKAFAAQSAVALNTVNLAMDDLMERGLVVVKSTRRVIADRRRLIEDWLQQG